MEERSGIEEREWGRHEEEWEERNSVKHTLTFQIIGRVLNPPNCATKQSPYSYTRNCKENLIHPENRQTIVTVHEERSHSVCHKDKPIKP